MTDLSSTISLRSCPRPPPFPSTPPFPLPRPPHLPNASNNSGPSKKKTAKKIFSLKLEMGKKVKSKQKQGYPHHPPPLPLVVFPYCFFVSHPIFTSPTTRSDSGRRDGGKRRGCQAVRRQRHHALKRRQPEQPPPRLERNAAATLHPRATAAPALDAPHQAQLHAAGRCAHDGLRLRRKHPLLLQPHLRVPGRRHHALPHPRLPPQHHSRRHLVGGRGLRHLCLVRRFGMPPPLPLHHRQNPPSFFHTFSPTSLSPCTHNSDPTPLSAAGDERDLCR